MHDGERVIVVHDERVAQRARTERAEPVLALDFGRDLKARETLPLADRLARVVLGPSERWRR